MEFGDVHKIAGFKLPGTGRLAPFNDIAFAAPGQAAVAPRILWRIDHGAESTPSKGSVFGVLSEQWPT